MTSREDQRREYNEQKELESPRRVFDSLDKDKNNKIDFKEVHSSPRRSPCDRSGKTSGLPSLSFSSAPLALVHHPIIRSPSYPCPSLFTLASLICTTIAHIFLPVTSSPATFHISLSCIIPPIALLRPSFCFVFPPWTLFVFWNFAFHHTPTPQLFVLALPFALS